jgi:peptide/nickel transport system substrate-binding protein
MKMRLRTRIDSPSTLRTASRHLLVPLCVGLLMVCIALGLAACGGSTGTGSTGSSGDEGGSSADSKLRIGTVIEPLPNIAESPNQSNYGTIYYALAYAPLIHEAPNGELEPALATSWHYVEGSGKPHTKFELTVRKGVKFSDGTPVTAAAVVKWFTYFTESPGPFKEVFGKGPKFSPSGENVLIELTEPNPSLPTILSDGGPNVGFVMSPKAVENPKLLTKATYGAGPYMLDASRSVHEDHSTYVQNPNYYDPSAIKFKEVELKVIAEPASRLEAQQAGQLDVALGDPSTIEPAEAAGFSVATAPLGVQYLVLDSKTGSSPALKDKRVREAINYAVDRDSIAEALVGKTGTPASTFLVSDLESGMDDYWKFDPAKAKELLAEAGYAKGLTLPTISPGPFAGALGEPMVRAVAKNLEEVGIKLDVTSVATSSAYAEEAFSGKAPVFLLAQLLGATPVVYGTYLAPTAAVNFYGTDPEMVKLYNEGAVAKDPTEAWKTMWERFTTQAYVLPVVVNPNLYYVSDSIGGVEVSKEHSVSMPTEWYRQ